MGAVKKLIHQEYNKMKKSILDSKEQKLFVKPFLKAITYWDYRPCRFCFEDTPYYGRMCNKHLCENFGVYVDISLIENARYGLFAGKDFSKNDRVCNVSGKKVNMTCYRYRYPEGTFPTYCLTIIDPRTGEPHFVDALKSSDGLQRWINDGSHLPTGSNVYFDIEVLEDGGLRPSFRARRAIYAGEEITTDYGPNYWFRKRVVDIYDRIIKQFGTGACDSVDKCLKFLTLSGFPIEHVSDPLMPFPSFN